MINCAYNVLFRIQTKKRNYATLLMNQARCKYYSEFIEKNSADQSKLFNAANSLLTESKKLSLPGGSNPEVVANNIGRFFIEMVTRSIHSKLGNPWSNSVRNLYISAEKCWRASVTLDALRDCVFVLNEFNAIWLANGFTIHIISYRVASHASACGNIRTLTEKAYKDSYVPSWHFYNLHFFFFKFRSSELFCFSIFIWRRKVFWFVNRTVTLWSGKHLR